VLLGFLSLTLWQCYTFKSKLYACRGGDRRRVEAVSGVLLLLHSVALVITDSILDQ
jgi:hypothetical protein